MDPTKPACELKLPGPKMEMEKLAEFLRLGPSAFKLP